MALFHLKDVYNLNISRAQFASLLKSGEVFRIAHDFYRHVTLELDPVEESFAAACAHFGGKGVIGGLSALAYYNLAEQVPSRIWVLVPYPYKATSKTLRPIRTKSSLETSVVSKRYFRIVSLERAVVEAFRYSTKIGLETAVRAARSAFSRKETTPTKLLKVAKELGMERFVIRHWEAITVEAGST
jgi:predicted transcriptional regulator of viral defense system